MQSYNNVAIVERDNANNLIHILQAIIRVVVSVTNFDNNYEKSLRFLI